MKAIVIGLIAHDQAVYSPAKDGEKPVVIELDRKEYDRLLKSGVIAPMDEATDEAMDEATVKKRRKPAEQV